MTDEEWLQLKDFPSAAIVAPAGHGKTEILCDIVVKCSGKVLLLTHTNAGIESIKKRLSKKNVPSNRYNVETIASFCIKWCNSYSKTANFNRTLDPFSKNRDEVTKYYNQTYSGCVLLFSNRWIGDVLKATYSRVIVDEYQDCSLKQHEIMKRISVFLPIIVLGDPLQSIFSFSEPVVDWNDLGFPRFDLKTDPWRWKYSNPELGEYLAELRKELLALRTSHYEIKSEKFIELIDPLNFKLRSISQLAKNYSSVLYLTKWSKKQLNICPRMRGMLQYDEKQDCFELFDFSKMFDENSGTPLALKMIDFLASCAIGVNKELSSFRNNLSKGKCIFPKIKKHIEIGRYIEKICLSKDKNELDLFLFFVAKKLKLKIYRSELFYEMVRSIRLSKEKGVSIEDASHLIRKDSRFQKRYSNFKLLSSRTLLSKGLEFDCVVINLEDPFSKNDFYVAMTRAMKKIYIVSPSRSITFSDK